MALLRETERMPVGILEDTELKHALGLDQKKKKKKGKLTN